MKKYTCEKGQFPCSICGTVYPYSDLRDMCEGKPYYLKEEPDPRLAVLDKLKAEVGERVIVTQYHGEDYAPAGYKQGIFLTYRWDVVRERRVVPPLYTGYNFMGKSFRHFAEYRIGEVSPGAEIVGDYWDVMYMGGSYSVGFAIGPRHVWSKAAVEAEGNVWPDYVIKLCVGEKSVDLLRKKKEEGYYIYDHEVR